MLKAEQIWSEGGREEERRERKGRRPKWVGT